METIFGEIQKALDAKLYYLAVAVTLSVPDICAALECEPTDIHVKGDDYIKWCDRNLAAQLRYFNLTSEDLYKLRGGVLHPGCTFGHRHSRFTAVIFTFPIEIMHSNVHDIQIGDDRALNLDPAHFCHEIMSGAREWYASKGVAHPNVQKNRSRVVRYRPGGYPPYFVGLPVIA